MRGVKKMHRYGSVLLIVLAAILWGTTGTAQTFAPEGANPLVLGAVRLIIGGGALLGLVVLQGKLKKGKWPLTATLVAAGGMAAYQPLFFSAVSLTGVAIGTVVAIGSAPILAGMLEWIFRRKVPQQKWWIATCLGVIGCVLLFLSGQDIHLNPLGILLALGAGLSFAAYTLVSKTLLQHHPPEAVVAVVFTLAAIVLSPLLFFHDLSWLKEPNGISVALHLGILTTAVAYVLFVRGLVTVNASTAVTLALIEPLTAALLGVMVVGEVLTLIAYCGMGLMFLGLYLLTVTNQSRPEKN
jgi:DME family drug/metabolite transporter